MKKNIIPFYPSSNKLVEKSSGFYQFDSDGKRYIDFESGVWCTNLGHSHERIVSVITEQAKTSIHHGYRFRNKMSEKLSEELQRLIGYENGASIFLSSGSEAVNLSISIAQKLTKKKKVLKISNSYLSAYGLGKIDPTNESLVNVPFNDIEAIKKIDFKEISALVMETGGASIDIVQFPEKEFVKELVETSKKNKLLIIAEEVTTGFGRLGKWFGFQNYDCKPDIVVTGKALGNGYPISAVTVNENTLKSLENELFIYAQSHQNDPLGCAIGLEVIKIIEEERILENCAKIGSYFSDKLEKLRLSFPTEIKEIRSKGLMLAIEFQPTYDGNKINRQLFDLGFVFGFRQNAMRFLPPLTITENEIDILIENLERLLKKV
ncbi:aspartate aminotransferase family protein [Carboxylicivirga sp. N1Y90]|uniref:aspartate aminotransferase family protein n=1 Tax=Carboxylicivirga fragile TaxID=3417571 RepID=UPI003D331C65|nr:aspartate aminotransferase family protein [Marinilabiliaceae bacterium N1Y90]